MQYPIIDNLIPAYLANGWTGLDIPETIELNYYQEGSGDPSPTNIRPIYPGAIININGVDTPIYGGVLNVQDNQLTITKQRVNVPDLTWNKKNVNGIIYYDSLPLTNINNRTTTSPATDIVNNKYKVIAAQIPIIGQNDFGCVHYLRYLTIRDITITEVSEFRDSDSYFIYDYETPEIVTLTQTETASYINGAFSNDIAHRLKLPLHHYFPHPVIDALQRAAAGTQTADDAEILQHYLTPLGIGGI